MIPTRQDLPSPPGVRRNRTIDSQKESVCEHTARALCFVRLRSKKRCALCVRRGRFCFEVYREALETARSSSVRAVVECLISGDGTARIVDSARSMHVPLFLGARTWGY